MDCKKNDDDDDGNVKDIECAIVLFRFTFLSQVPEKRRRIKIIKIAFKCLSFAAAAGWSDPQ